MATGLVVAGLVLSLIGAYVASTIPLGKALRTAGSFGGGREEDWDELLPQIKRRTLTGNILLVFGTALQIWGSLGAFK